jgi:hypothetical protein
MNAWTDGAAKMRRAMMTVVVVTARFRGRATTKTRI